MISFRLQQALLNLLYICLIEHHFVFAVAASGTIFGFGQNTDGQLGDGSNQNTQFSPVMAVGLSNVIFLSAGQYHSLSVLSNGSVCSWGDNLQGQLGVGTTLSSDFPGVVLGVMNPIQVSAGGSHSLALMGNGTVFSWGWNVYGQLGDNTTIQRNSSVMVLGLSGVTQVGAGIAHSLALASGIVYSWGENNQGQIGDGTVNNRETPVMVPGFSNAVQISAGGYHSMALLANGSLFAWGDNQYGQLGNNNTSNGYTPGLVLGGLTNITQISAGGYHSMALLANGNVFAWGSNQYGQLSSGINATQSTLPLMVSGLPNSIIAISAGGYHSLALANEFVYAWGWNAYGQLGVNSTSGPITMVPGLFNVSQISAGVFHSLTIGSMNIQTTQQQTTMALQTTMEQQTTQQQTTQQQTTGQTTAQTTSEHASDAHSKIFSGIMEMNPICLLILLFL